MKMSLTGRSVRILILSLYGLFLLFPMYWMITSALKGPALVVQTPPELFPSEITFINFTHVLFTTRILTWIWNTLVVASISAVGYVLFCSMAGYAFAKKEFPGKNAIFWLYISTLMLPFFSFLVPLYLVIVDLNLINTYWAMILPAWSGPFGVFLMKQYMTSFPGELVDASRIDGCNEFETFCRIVLPVCKPALVFLGVISFVARWNDFLWPMLVSTRDDTRLLQVGIALFSQQFITDHGSVMAAGSIGALPVVILFLIFQRHIVGGINIGAIKG